VELVNPATGQIDASFIRGEVQDVIYTLQGQDSLTGTCGHREQAGDPAARRSRW
jgi:hypothetical protein